VDIRKSVITAAGQSQRTLPLQTLVDRDGAEKTALQIIIEESIMAGMEEIGVIIHPDDETAYRAAAGPHARRLQFIPQHYPLGYGHAVLCAKEFTAGEPFLLMVGDHLYVSRSSVRCARQLVDIASRESCAVSAVQETHESKLPHYGAVGGTRVQNRSGLYEIRRVLEKPTPTQAEQELDVPGLRLGHYLCFFGMHVLTPPVFEFLEAAVTAAAGQSPVSLTSSLSKLAQRGRYLAAGIDGRRYDMGVHYGLLTAQLALGLDGDQREEVLALMVELLAARAR
jgi:UTP--glucose-1-phosphate uridylyltransferase